MFKSLYQRKNLRFVDSPTGGDPVGGGTPNPTPPAGGDSNPAPESKDEQLGEGGKKALQAERERANAAEKRAKELEKQIEDSKKSAEQLAAEELETAKASVTAAETKALKYEIAAEKGLDLKLAARLTGSTREELEADADTLKSLVGATPPNNPKPDPHQGGGNTTTAKGVGAGRELFHELHPRKKTN